MKRNSFSKMHLGQDVSHLSTTADKAIPETATLSSSVMPDSTTAYSSVLPNAPISTPEDTSSLACFDPRTKILCTTALLLASIIAQGWVAQGVVGVATMAALIMTRTSPRRIWRFLRPLIPLLLCLVICDALLVSGGDVYFSWGLFSVTERGCAFALETALRFVEALLLSSALMVSTTPTELTDGVRLLAQPVSRVGVPVERFTLALSITFRFVPVLVEEFNHIKLAQQDRCAHFSQGGVVRRVKAYIPVMAPLVVSAFRRAFTLAVAMENRSFGIHKARTCLRSYHLRVRDGVVILGSLVFVMGIIVCAGM